MVAYRLKIWFKIWGTPQEVLSALKASEKTEKGEYCVVLDLHRVQIPENEKQESEVSTEAKLIEEMVHGKSLRDAQEALIEKGEKKNAVKQAAINMKKMFTED